MGGEKNRVLPKAGQQSSLLKGISQKRGGGNSGVEKKLRNTRMKGKSHIGPSFKTCDPSIENHENGEGGRRGTHSEGISPGREMQPMKRAYVGGP